MKDACDYIAKDKELEAIIRRIDLNGDKIITYCEWRDFMPPEYNSENKILNINKDIYHYKQPPNNSTKCVCVECKINLCVCPNTKPK